MSIKSISFVLLTFFFSSSLFASLTEIDTCHPNKIDLDYAYKTYMIKGSRTTGKAAKKVLSSILKIDFQSDEIYRHQSEGIDSLGYRYFTPYTSVADETIYIDKRIEHDIIAKEYDYCSKSNSTPEIVNCAKLCVFEIEYSEDR